MIVSAATRVRVLHSDTSSVTLAEDDKPSVVLCKDDYLELRVHLVLSRRSLLRLLFTPRSKLDAMMD